MVMAGFQFYLLDITYKVVDEHPVVYLFGKTTNNESVCVVDDSFRPYFYVVPKKGEDIKDRLKRLNLGKNNERYEIIKIEEIKKNFSEKEITVLKVYVNTPKSVPFLKDEIKSWAEVENIHEHDILFVRRYLVDKNITPLTLLHVEGEYLTEHMKVPVLKASKIESIGEDFLKNPRILALDIELYKPINRHSEEENPIVMAALYSKNFKKVITRKNFQTSEDYIEFVKSEADLILRLKEVIEEFSPDIITGYFSDGFDFPEIKNRANKYKVKLDLGLDYSELKVSGREYLTTRIEGIVHVDVFSFIRRLMRTSLKTDELTLNSVAFELLGERKHDVDILNLSKVWDKGGGELELYCKYNLHDARLAYHLCIKLFSNMVELVKIVGLPLYDITRMSYSQLVEWYIIRQAAQVNELVANRPNYNQQNERMDKRIKGAFVYEPKPGLYKNIVVFDYRSLYPTIIASHNISVGTLNCSCCEGQEIVPFEGDTYWFCKKRKGFLSNIIEDLITRRARIKEILKKGEKNIFLEARSEVLKLLANSFYGYLGFAQARWYCLECAEATTAWGRYYIKDVISKAEKEKFNVLYSDTDSIFLTLDDKTKEDARNFVERINHDLPGLMELEYEGFYPSGIFVSTKFGGSGAKKKYALLDERGVLNIKGFETVRRNWSFIAKDVQKNVLDILLRERDAEKALNYVRKIISDLKENLIPVDRVVIYTQLQKEIEDYESVGPHVAAAQKMKNKGLSVGPGTLIKFVVVKGRGKIRDKVKLADEIKQKEYDADYYANHQIYPSVEKIFSVFGYTKEDLLSEDQQSRLGSFI